MIKFCLLQFFLPILERILQKFSIICVVFRQFFRSRSIHPFFQEQQLFIKMIHRGNIAIFL